MIGLHGIGKAIEVEDGLTELCGVGDICVSDREVTTRFARVAAAEVEPRVDPAIDLEPLFVHPLAEAGVGDRGHQRAVD